MSVSAIDATTSEAATSRLARVPARLWQKDINVRDFIQQNYQPYDGDGVFLAPATARTQKIWETLKALFLEERKKGVLDVSQIPSSITAHAPGYIDRTTRSSSACRPRRRSSAPSCRTAASAWSSARSRPTATSPTRTWSRPSPSTARPTTTACSTPTPPTSGACRSSHVLTGLPDAYGRGRIIGDYRRVALYGVSRLIERKQQEKNALDRAAVDRRDHPRPRGAVASRSAR